MKTRPSADQKSELLGGFSEVGRINELLEELRGLLAQQHSRNTSKVESKSSVR